LVIGVDQRADEQCDDLVAAVAEEQLGGRDPERLGDGLGECWRPAVWIEMDARGLATDRIDSQGRGPYWILVVRQPKNGLAQLGGERIERRRHDVGLDLGEDRTPARGHRGRSVPSSGWPPRP